MNKTDLFKEKIQKVPLKKYFDDYDGGDDYEKGIKFIEEMYRKLNKHDKDRVFSFRTQATSASSVKNILENITSKVIEINVNLTKSL